MNTLKSIITNLRNRGLTFQEISDELKSKYGIEKSRQAIQGLYSRTVETRENLLSEYEVTLKIDIVNLYCIGYNMTQITNILNNMGVPVTYSRVSDIIKNNNSYIQSVNSGLLVRIGEIYDSCTVDQMKKTIEYKGFSITDSRFNQLIGEVITKRLKETIISHLNNSKLKGIDTKVIKDICDNIGILTMSDIRKS